MCEVILWSSAQMASFPDSDTANMSAVQGALRLLCSDLLQFIYLILVLPDIQLLIYLIRQEAARLALFARLLQAMPGGPQDPRWPSEAQMPHMRPKSVSVGIRRGTRCLPPTFSSVTCWMWWSLLRNRAKNGRPSSVVHHSGLLRPQHLSDPQCSSCDEGNPATSHCLDCQEYLCDNCVRAHQRVRLTKDHFIEGLMESLHLVNRTNTSNTPINISQSFHNSFAMLNVFQERIDFCQQHDNAVSFVSRGSLYFFRACFFFLVVKSELAAERL